MPSKRITLTPEQVADLLSLLPEDRGDLREALESAEPEEPDTVVVDLVIPEAPATPPAMSRTATVDPFPFDGDDRATVEIPLETMAEIVERGRRPTVDL